MALNAKTLSEDVYFFGHKACAGCGAALVVRHALKVLGPNAVCALPAGCMSAVGFNFPQMSFANNAMITPFAATASVLSGIEAGLRARGGAPDDAHAHGCLTEKKRLFEIVAAHGIPYAATASIGYLNDFIRKVDRAKGIHGTRFIHVIAPCPTGWGCAEDATISVAREVVDCGLWYLAEYEGGRFRINKKPKEFSSVAHYLRGQGRFRALTDGEIERVEAGRDETWRRLAKLEEL